MLFGSHEERGEGAEVARSSFSYSLTGVGVALGCSAESVRQVTNTAAAVAMLVSKRAAL